MHEASSPRGIILVVALATSAEEALMKSFLTVGFLAAVAFAAPASAQTAPTFYRDVLPILQDNCQGCHRPGEVGPFSLMTYKQAVSWAQDIKEYTDARRMPPWKPTGDSISFHNERRLSDKQIKTLADWVAADVPEGDAKD